MPGFTNIYAYMKQLRGSGLTPSERGVLMAVASYANRDGANARPGHDNLAKDLGISVRQVGKHIKSLRSKGFLAETDPGRRGPHGDVAARYSLTRPTGTKVPTDLSEPTAAKAQDSIGTIVPPTVGIYTGDVKQPPKTGGSVVARVPGGTPFGDPWGSAPDFRTSA